MTSLDKVLHGYLNQAVSNEGTLEMRSDIITPDTSDGIGFENSHEALYNRLKNRLCKNCSELKQWERVDGEDSLVFFFGQGRECLTTMTKKRETLKRDSVCPPTALECRNRPYTHRITLERITRNVVIPDMMTGKPQGLQMNISPVNFVETLPMGGGTLIFTYKLVKLSPRGSNKKECEGPLRYSVSLVINVNGTLDKDDICKAWKDRLKALLATHQIVKSSSGPQYHRLSEAELGVRG